ncbi:MAG: ABC transporter substrate-binding protein, partial [Dehalococcoidia bacterium]|nr:ABC transporter substrate-binding protein [Dehalococcoidia bacterium]
RSGGIRQMMYPNLAEGRPTRDVNFRQAVAWALDRQGIIDQVFPGIAVPAGSYLSDGTVYHDPALGGRYFNNGRPDLQRARDFLQRAGGPPNRELVFVVENTPDQVDMATIIQQNLRAIGLNVRISPEDVASYFPKFPFGDYDFLMFRSPTTTAVGFDPDYVFAGLFSTSPSNLNRFVDPEMDRLLNIALQAPAGPQAQAAWRAVSERDLQTLGQIQVVTLKNTEAISRNLRGYEVSGLPYMPSLPRTGLA